MVATKDPREAEVSRRTTKQNKVGHRYKGIQEKQNKQTKTSATRIYKHFCLLNGLLQTKGEAESRLNSLQTYRFPLV